MTCNVIELILIPQQLISEQVGSVLMSLKAILAYRIIKYYPFAINMMAIATSTLPSYLNLTFLMFVLILVYGLLG